MLNEQVAEELEPLAASLVEIERHVGMSGWDQPIRLFALVPTRDLIEAVPELADQLTVTAPDALTCVEQEELVISDLEDFLAQLSWPSGVTGAALSTERVFLPAEFEDDVPDDAVAAADFVATHPARETARVVAGALRTGEQFAVLRLASNPEELLMGENLVPGLTANLVESLLGEEEKEEV